MRQPWLCSNTNLFNISRQAKSPKLAALDSNRLVECGVGLYRPMAYSLNIWLQGVGPSVERLAKNFVGLW